MRTQTREVLNNGASIVYRGIEGNNLYMHHWDWSDEFDYVQWDDLIYPCQSTQNKLICVFKLKKLKTNEQKRNN